MRLSRVIIPVLLCVGICGTATANYFHNPNNNTSLNVGSAPSPTPDDLRLAEGRLAPRGYGDLRALLGKPVFGKDRGYLGSVSDVDSERGLVAVRIRRDEAVALSGKSLIDDGRRVLAPSISRAEFVAMPRIPESELQP